MSLYNFAVLGEVVVAPMGGAIPFVDGPYWSLFKDPLITAAVFPLVAVMVLFPLLERRRLFVLPLVLNTVFLVALIVLCDTKHHEMINKALQGRSPECLFVSSFLGSLVAAGSISPTHPHASFVERGSVYYWSYKQMKFYRYGSAPGGDACQRTYDGGK